MHSKIIIWGAKLDTLHTHAFIHEALVKAATYLNLPVYWLDNRDNVDESFFNDSLFITEQFIACQNPVSNKIPLNKSSTYIVNYLGNKGPIDGNPGPQMYLGKVKKLIDFRFACNWGVDGVEDKNYAYVFDKTLCEPINLGTSFYQKDLDYDIFYSIWATDLLPTEIDFEDRFTNFKEPRYASFGGSISKGWQSVYDGNYDTVIKFAEECNKNGIKFLHNNPHKNPLPSNVLKKFCLESFLPFECRPLNHLKNGYLSCRAIKNISYGCLGMSNSKIAYDFFDQEIAYSEDIVELFYIAKEMQYHSNTKNLILNQMQKIKMQHTYVNRLQDMITASEM